MRAVTAEAKIPNAGQNSNIVDLREVQLLALQLPAAFTGVAITFQSAWGDSDTLQPVHDSAGAAVSLTVAQGRYVVLAAATRDALQGLGRTRIVSGSAEGADRTVTLICVPR